MAKKRDYKKEYARKKKRDSLRDGVEALGLEVVKIRLRHRKVPIEETK